MVNLTIDDKSVSVPDGTTILRAAEQLEIHIPRLCYHPKLSLAGSCRVCLVEVKETGLFVAACSTPVTDGMVIETTSPAIRQARRDIIELLLDNHPKDCQTCERDANCELQNLAYALGVRERLFEGKRKEFPTDTSSHSVVRNPEKCIACGRCVRVCAEVQGVHNLSQQGRGFTVVVGPAHEAKMDESVCIQCGQCINVCPTAAFLEHNHTERVWNALADPDMHVVVHTAPAIRAAIGEGFDLAPGTPSTGKMVTALRRLGFDRVFDTDLAADLTIMEEANEFIRRLNGEGVLPMLTSCSPGWVSFLERFYPEMIPHASTCKSPMSMMSALIKEYYAKIADIPAEKIFVVAVMPCVAKKFEAQRPEHIRADGMRYTDAVLTTRELIWMIKCYGINFAQLPEGEFDAPLGIATGAGDIFGTTGGVMEATLRTACELITGVAPEKIEFTQVRAVEGLREAELNLAGKTVRVGVANGLNNAKILLDLAKENPGRYHVLEVMACPGGCIGGGGQPYPPNNTDVLDPELLRLRAQALYTIDGAKKLRKSHENPAVKKLYTDMLGEPGSEIAHKLLHTEYHSKLPRGIR